jgi:hypothetical protein
MAQCPVAEADRAAGSVADHGEPVLVIGGDEREGRRRRSRVWGSAGVADHVELAELHRLAAADPAGSVIEVVAEGRGAEGPGHNRAAVLLGAKVSSNCAPVGALQLRLEVGEEDEAEEIGAEKPGDDRGSAQAGDRDGDCAEDRHEGGKKVAPEDEVLPDRRGKQREGDRAEPDGERRRREPGGAAAQRQ